MSNVRQSDVKNHLSPRFRTKIHLCEPNTQSDAAGVSQEEFAGAEPKAHDSMEDAPHLSSTSGRKPIAIVTPESVRD